MKNRFDCKTVNDLYFFEVQGNGKAPATPNGFKNARQWVGIDQILKKGFNVGLALEPSGLIAIDVDDHDGTGSGEKELMDLMIKLGTLPQTVIQTTPNAGFHLIFSAKGIEKPRGKLSKNIDLKFNGYILFAGSSINGKQYKFVEDTVEDGLFKFAHLPQGWLDYINTTKNTCNNQPKTNAPKSHKKYDLSEEQINQVVESCAFLRYCDENVYDLGEPEWFSQVNLLVFMGATDEYIHAKSSGYYKYSPEETQKKIDNARKFGYGQNCDYLSNTFPDICQNCSQKGG